jgi:hypothetical protein
MPPAWLISLIITLLQKTGAINYLEGLAIKGGLKGLEELKKVKTVPEYPTEKDNAFHDNPPSHEV